MRFLKLVSLSRAALLVIMLTTAACGKKAQLEAEASQMQQTANEQTALMKNLQAESAAIGNLGHYNYPQQVHMDQLRARIKTLRDETKSLEEDKVKAQKDLDALQAELDAYRARHLR
ncbi:MAG: hypothetical protein CJBNEKGG_02952 [Prosthecobacter sp.]|nr:hypothetical protein [Prosthecobacter sp.]